jgi:hypothetical protein
MGVAATGYARLCSLSGECDARVKGLSTVRVNNPGFSPVAGLFTGPAELKCRCYSCFSDSSSMHLRPVRPGYRKCVSGVRPRLGGACGMRWKAVLFALALSSAPAVLAIPPSTGSNYMSARMIESIQPWMGEPANPVELASQAFSHCVMSGMRNLDSTIGPDAAAASLMDTCASQLRAVERETERVIAATHWAEARKDVARAELRARFALAEQRVSARISQIRLRTASLR